MFRTLNIIFLLSLILIVTSCFKDDELVMPHKPGTALTDTVALTGFYSFQAFYNLQKNEVVKILEKESWDLGFEASHEGWRVLLNSSNFMKAANAGGQAFGLHADTAGAQWIFNPSDGSADSLAIGRWFTVNGNDTLGNGQMLLIDRGVNGQGISRGFRQLMIDSLSSGTYYFRVARIDGSGVQSFAVAKNPECNLVLCSFDNPAAVISEPEIPDWDILFTQYTTLLYTDLGEAYPYLVTGVLLNESGVEVAEDTLHTFDNMDFSTAQSLNFSRQADVIGYKWKIYDFNAASYTVDTKLLFVIRDMRGYLYKFRFVGFYNNKGEKGFPSFEYQRL